MYKLLISKKAIEDLDGIWNYTAMTWSDEQAEKYYHQIYDCIKYLSSLTNFLGKKYDFIKTGLIGYHIGHHIIFYKKSRNGTIWINRILHERMDFERHI